jgi:hypothetical protein
MGIIVHLINVPVSWRSKTQRGVTLSRRKAEYVTISEAIKEFKFSFFLLHDIGIDMELPIVAKTDGIGAKCINGRTHTSFAYLVTLHKRKH